MPCNRPDCTICRDTHDFQRGVRAAVSLVREAASIYRDREPVAEAPYTVTNLPNCDAPTSPDYAARVALESAASNIELTLLGSGKR